MWGDFSRSLAGSKVLRKPSADGFNVILFNRYSFLPQVLHLKDIFYVEWHFKKKFVYNVKFVSYRITVLALSIGSVLLGAKEVRVYVFILQF